MNSRASRWRSTHLTGRLGGSLGFRSFLEAAESIQKSQRGYYSTYIVGVNILVEAFRAGFGSWNLWVRIEGQSGIAVS